eukprot:104652_1
MADLPFETVQRDSTNLILHTVAEKDTINTATDSVLCENVLSKIQTETPATTRKRKYTNTNKENITPQTQSSPHKKKRKISSIENSSPINNNTNNNVRNLNIQTHRSISLTHVEPQNNVIDEWPSIFIPVNQIREGNKDYIEQLKEKISTNENFKIIENKTKQWLDKVFKRYGKICKAQSKESLIKMYYVIRTCIKLATN